MIASAPILVFVASSRESAAVGFYRGRLGLELVDEEPGVAATFALAGGARLRLTFLERHSAPAHTVVGWQVGDIDAVLDALATAGIEPERFDGLHQDERGVAAFPNGDRVAWFADPDGNLLSLTQWGA